MRVFIFVSILFALATCKSEEGPPAILDYFLDPDHSEEGVVNKYYDHFYPTEKNRESRTNISYSLTKQNSPSTFSVEWYNAGFELMELNQFRIENGKVHLDSSVTFYGMARLDTMISKIETSVFAVWDKKNTELGLKELMDFDGDKYEVERIQTKTLDSIILNKPAKTLVGDRSVTSLNRDTTFNYQYAATYVKGMGLYTSLSTQSNGRTVSELVEQMPLSAFRKLSRHDKKRVAYIDPVNTIDDALYFELCGHERKIVDYYNSSPDVRFSEGKGQMKKIIRSKLEREKLKGESGYLTFRFVVNCKGKSGRFVLEQSDLDYREKQFHKETIDHLYKITYDLQEWKPSVIRDEPRDTYVYITYKLQNGVVTDVLP